MGLSKKRGIALITVMFVVLLVAMISRATIVNGPSMALKAERARIKSLARRAAEAGASYARVQIRENRDWKGDANALVVDTPTLKILEDNGNVIGWIKGPRGQVSMFRIRFNYRDGAAGGEGLDNSANPIDNIYLSLNNITGTADVRVPDINPATFVVDDPNPDPSAFPGALICPTGHAMIRVEGWSGAAVAAATGPTSLPVAGEYLSDQVIRAVYAPAPPSDVADSAVSAGGGIQTQLESSLDVSVVGTGTARLRSKLGIDVSDFLGAVSNLNMTGEVTRDPGLGLNAVAAVTETDETVGDGNDFLNVDWAGVPQASTDPNSAIQLPGGMYVVDAGGNYHYYDMDKTAYEALTPDPTTFIRPGGTPLSADFVEVRGAPNVTAVGGLNVSPTGFSIDITEDVNVVASAGGQNDILFTTLGGRKFQETDVPGVAPYLFSGVHPDYAPLGVLNMQDCIMSNPVGELGLLIDIRGENASLVAETGVVMSASGIKLEVPSIPTVEQRLSIYAKEDVTISTYISVPTNPYVPEYEGYGPLQLEGLIYTQGDANILAGTEGTVAPDPATGHQGYGDVLINGALVAYGGDPSAFVDTDPTTGPGTGNVDGSVGLVKILGKSAEINFDQTKLVPDPSAFPGAPLDDVVRVSYGFENS